MRLWSLGLGLAVLAGAWLGPLPALARHAFLAHMAMHVAVVAVAAPLLAVALADSRCNPVRGVPRLLAPIPTALLEGVVVWAWHAPALHRAARQLPLAMAFEQASFLAVALLVWLSACGGGRDRAGAGIVALLLTSMHMTLLGALLALASRPLHGRSGGFLGLTALQDQQLGGVLMLLGGGSAYLIGGLCLLRGLLRQPGAAA